MSDTLSKVRNALLRVSQGVLASPDFKERRTFQRFFKCGNVPYVSDEIDIRYSPGQGTAHYGNVVHCGSVWLCPECSSKISAVRCKENKKAISNWLSLDPDNFVAMLTLTHSHTIDDSLADLLENQSEALQRFWRHGSVRRLLKSIGCVGRINCFEITYGPKTGWHPHRHILLFCKKQDDIEGLGCKLRAYWTQALEKFDLKGNNYSLNLQGGAHADQYVTKLALEVSLSNLKRSPDGSERYTPFALLNLIKENLLNPPLWAVKAFQEYALATRGKHQFSWSKKLKELLGLVEVSDEELAEAEPPDSVTLVTIPFEVFKKIRGKFIVYHALLECASRGDPLLLEHWLNDRGYYVRRYAA